MNLVSQDLVEFRVCRSTPSKDGNSTNYYYTFEDDEQSFQVFSRKRLDLKKGDLGKMVFSTRLWDNKLQYDFIDFLVE